MRNIKFLPPLLQFHARDFPGRKYIGRLHAYVCIEYRMVLPQQKDVVSRCRSFLSSEEGGTDEPSGARTKQKHKLCHLQNYDTDPLCFSWKFIEVEE